MNPFKLIHTSIEGCYEIIPLRFEDSRGRFVKIFHSDLFEEYNLMTKYEEEYYAVSNKGVLRGLHFQEPPNEHVKLVTCLSGRILDVVVDLRKNSTTYSKWHSIELSGASDKLLYVPEGLAHGYYTMEDNTVFISLNSRKFSPESDSGILWNSIGFDWPDLSPILSEKDKKLASLEAYVSPF